MKKLLVVPFTLALSCNVLAVEHEGIAPLGMDGIASARQAAIADALENAALFNGATVRASSLNTQKGSADAVQLRGTPQGDYRFVREWQSNGFLHVVVDVQPPGQQAEENQAGATASSAPVSHACPGADYKRKVLVAHFWVQHPSQTQDLSSFSDGLQVEMARKLYDSGRFLPQKSAGEAAFDLQPQFYDPLLQPDFVRELARRYAVQFIIGGIVRDTSFSGESYGIANGSEIRPGERKLALNIPLINFTQLGLKAMPAARNFDLDLFVFDGVSGGLINRHQLSGQAKGKVVQSPDASVGSASFRTTDFGQLIDSKLSEAGLALQQDVSCIPFSARVTRVEKGQVYFDAGATSRIAPGDVMQVYRLKSGGTPVDAASFDPGMRLGVPEEAVGSLTVTQVQPLFAVGVTHGPVVTAGDYVRFVGQERAK